MLALFVLLAISLIVIAIYVYVVFWKRDVFQKRRFRYFFAILSSIVIVFFLVVQYMVRHNTIQKVDKLYQFIEYDRYIDSILFYNGDKEMINNSLDIYQKQLLDINKKLETLSLFIGKDTANDKRIKQAQNLIEKRRFKLKYVNKQSSGLFCYDSSEETNLIKIEPVFNSNTTFSDLIFKSDSSLSINEILLYKVREIRNDSIGNSHIIFEKDYFPNENSKANISIIPNPYLEGNITIEVGFISKKEKNYKYSYLKVQDYAECR